jgi:hypothetical protein
LCLDGHKTLAAGYYGLDINGIIDDPTDAHELRRTVHNYLGIHSH